MRIINTPIIKYQALALVTLSSVTALPVSEAKPFSVYGHLNVSLHNVDDQFADESLLELRSNGSRFGFKGSTGLRDKMTAFYELEWGINVTDGDDNSNEIVTRNQIVGVRGSFGQVFAGRHDTPLRMLGLKIDLFDEMVGDIQDTFNGEIRASNIIQYTAPKFQGNKLEVKGAMILSEADSNDPNSPSNGTSISAAYRERNLWVAAALDNDVEGEGISTMRVVGTYKMGAWLLGGMFQSTEDGDGDGESSSGQGFLVNATYKIDRIHRFKAQWASSDIAESNMGGGIQLQSQIALAFERQLGSKTKAFAYYITGENDPENADNVQEQTYIGVGIEHKF